jgi:hypothetical protein
VYVLLHHELFVEVESARHLEDMLPAVVLCFSGLREGHKGAVGARRRSGAKGRSVGQRMVRDGPPVSLLFPDERQRFIVFLHLSPFGDRIMIFASCAQ